MLLTGISGEFLTFAFCLSQWISRDRQRKLILLPVSAYGDVYDVCWVTGKVCRMWRKEHRYGTCGLYGLLHKIRHQKGRALTTFSRQIRLQSNFLPLSKDIVVNLLLFDLCLVGFLFRGLLRYCWTHWELLKWIPSRFISGVIMVQCIDVLRGDTRCIQMT